MAQRRTGGAGRQTLAPPVRMIQVGLGAWGRNWARDIVPRVAAVEVVAWADSSAAARTTAIDELGLPPARCFVSLGEAAEATAAEAVLGTVALVAHAPVIDAALALGKHVLIEKPFAPTAEEAQRLTDAAAAAGRVLQVSHNYRFFPAVVAARRLLQERRLGAAIAVDIDFHQYAPGREYRYYDIPDPLLADMLIHMFDLIRFVLGRGPVEVVCWSWNPPGSPFKYDAAAAIMVRLAGGVVVTLRGSWVSREAPTPWAGRWRIQCDDGVIGFTSRGPAASGTDDDRVVLRPLGGAETELRLDPMPLYDRAGTLDAFAHAVRGQPTAGWEVTAADNLGSLRLMEAAIRSAAAGGAPTAVVHAAVAASA